jgi:adenine phosphoribosyltransferase
VISALAAVGRDEAGVRRIDTVVGIEARGFILAAPVAHVLGAGMVPVRKAGKLPYQTRSARYSLEYGEATVEVHRDAFDAGDRVLVVDDVLATGGTVAATAGLVREAGAEVVAVAVLMELGFLAGRDRLAGLVDLHALLSV